MSNDKLKSLLQQLKQELDNQAVTDAETAQLARELDAEIHDLLDPDTEQSVADTALDKARSLESEFAADHPVVAQFLRQIIDTLGKMGI